MTLAELLVRLEGVRPCAGGYVARCPAHEDRKPSLSIRSTEGGKVLLYCHAGCPYRAIVVALGGRPCRVAFGLPTGPPTKGPCSSSDPSEYSRRIRQESQPAPGTPVERYLRSRGITLPLPPTVLFHPNLKHPTGGYFPALVAVVQAVDGAMVAVHRTYLAADGSGKANAQPNKAALGPIGGGSVRLAPATETVALTEGVEDALSIMQATGIPAWAALGSNLARVKLLNHLSKVTICADADAAGDRLAHQAAERFLLEGRRVEMVKPHGGKDFNDRLRA